MYIYVWKCEAVEWVSIVWMRIYVDRYICGHHLDIVTVVLCVIWWWGWSRAREVDILNNNKVVMKSLLFCLEYGVMKWRRAPAFRIGCSHSQSSIMSLDWRSPKTLKYSRQNVNTVCAPIAIIPALCISSRQYNHNTNIYTIRNSRAS